MKCRHAKRKLSEFLDGVLTPAEEAGLREHLEQCQDCSRELELLRKTVAALRSLPKHTPPQDLPSKIRAALAGKRAAKPRLFAVRPLQTAAAAALLVFLGVYGFFMRELARRPVPEQALQSRETETMGLPAAAPDALDADRTAGPEQKKHVAGAKLATPEPEQPQLPQAMAETDGYAPALPAAEARAGAAAAQPAEEKKQVSVLSEETLKAKKGTEKEYAERMREESRMDKSAFAVPPPPSMPHKPSAPPALNAMPAAEHFRRETDAAEATIPEQKTIELTLENADIRAVRAVLSQYAPTEFETPADSGAAACSESAPLAAAPLAAGAIAHGGAAAAKSAQQAKRQIAASAAGADRGPVPSVKKAAESVFTARVPAAEYHRLITKLQRLGRLSAPAAPHLESAGELEILVRLTVHTP